MQILVIGCGSIGERHIRNLRSLGLSDIGAVDPLATRLDTVARNYDVRPHCSLQAGLEKKPDAVLVCTPPHSHISVAQQAIAAGCHVFIEKPLSDTLEG